MFGLSWSLGRCGRAKLNRRAQYGHAASQYRQPMHQS
jgi:hypothetical protein